MTPVRMYPDACPAQLAREVESSKAMERGQCDRGNRSASATAPVELTATETGMAIIMRFPCRVADGARTLASIEPGCRDIDKGTFDRIPLITTVCQRWPSMRRLPAPV